MKWQMKVLIVSWMVLDDKLVGGEDDVVSHKVKKKMT